jgi:hypothetical protein
MATNEFLLTAKLRDLISGGLRKIASEQKKFGQEVQRHSVPLVAQKRHFDDLEKRGKTLGKQINVLGREFKSAQEIVGKFSPEVAAATGAVASSPSGVRRSVPWPNLASQFVQQRLCVLQIERIEPFGEPAVDRSEKLASLIPLALIAPEPRHAHCGA